MLPLAHRAASTRRALATGVAGIALLSVGPRVLGAQEPGKPRDPDPTIDQYLDTAAVRRALAARAPFTDARRAARILTVSYDSLGAVAAVTAPVAALIPQPSRDSLVAIVRAHARPIAPRPRGWQTHLLLSAGDSAKVEETALASTSAEVANRPGLVRALEYVAQDLVRDDPSLVGRTLAVRLRLVLTSDGAVESHTMLISSGDTRIDEAAVRLVRRTPFRAAIIEGEPVGSIVVLPLRFVFPEE